MPNFMVSKPRRGIAGFMENAYLHGTLGSTDVSPEDVVAAERSARAFRTPCAFPRPDASRGEKVADSLRVPAQMDINCRGDEELVVELILT